MPTPLLQTAVVGLGFGMNLRDVASAGMSGLGYSAASIALCMLAGALLRRVLGVGAPVGLLVTAGTAICGGSAIAAVAPVIRAKVDDVAVGVVFVLNAAALVLFPAIGHALGLDQMQFGVWAALAIHDTSSVVGAASQYGEQALGVATTLMLVRALWISV